MRVEEELGVLDELERVGQQSVSACVSGAFTYRSQRNVLSDRNNRCHGSPTLLLTPRACHRIYSPPATRFSTLTECLEPIGKDGQHLRCIRRPVQAGMNCTTMQRGRARCT